jgi:hypothetical protein
MALFPNLHTVQLHFQFFRERHHGTYIAYDGRNLVDDVFKARQYPSIKNVFICPASIMFLRACPEARFVAPLKRYKEFWSSEIFEKVLNECPALEVLGPFYFDKSDIRSEGHLFLLSSPSNSSRSDILLVLAVATRLPKLREINLAPYLFQAVCP